ncbi:MAG: hypothetical protein H7A46_12780 [Verrucomicrobiales bacterium]|nr:hypothetical protein [Verrucomicrobiales bacterium]
MANGKGLSVSHTAEQTTGQLEEKLAGLREAAADESRQTELLQLRAEVTRLHQREQELEGEIGRLQQAVRQQATALEQRQALVAEDTALQAVREQQKQVGIAKMNYARRWTLAFLMYAGDHDEQFPSTLAAAADYFVTVDPPEAADPAIYAALQPGQYEVMYHGSTAEVTSPATTILLREQEAWPDWTGSGANRVYGFVDGHSEVHHASDGDFTAWEAERMGQRQPR